MTQDEAVIAWREIATELDQRFRDVRPKLKSFEAAMISDRVRNAALAAYPTATSTAELRQAALAALPPLSYMKKSRFRTNPGRRSKELVAGAINRGRASPPARRSRADPVWVSGVLFGYLMGDGDGGRPETDTPEVRTLVTMAGMSPEALHGDRGFWAGEILNGLVARQELSIDDASMIADHVMGRPYQDPACAEAHVDARRLSMLLGGPDQFDVEPHRRPPQAKVTCDPCRVGDHASCNSPAPGGICGCWCNQSTQRYAGPVPAAPRARRDFLRNPLLAVVGNDPLVSPLAPEQQAARGKRKPRSKQQKKANPLLAVVGNPANPLYEKGQQGFKKFHGKNSGRFLVFNKQTKKWREISRAEAERWQGAVAIGLGAVPETHYMVPEEWNSSKGPHYYVHEHPEGKEPLEVKDVETGLTSKLPTSSSMTITDWWRH